MSLFRTVRVASHREKDLQPAAGLLQRNSCLWGFCKIKKVGWQNVNITINLQSFQKH